MNSGKSAAIRAFGGRRSTIIDPLKDPDAPVGKYDETKWLLYDAKSNSFWGVTAWCDRWAGASVYDTKQEAEAEAFLTCAECPEFIGNLSVVPTTERYRDDKVLSEIAMREKFQEEQKRKEDAAFQRWYDKETKRLNTSFK
jgi:hypothetical protein